MCTRYIVFEVHQLTREERARKIESYGNAYAVLVDALERFPQEMWQFRDSHGCWSIHEHVVHIADSEANSYIRCRRFIAEPGEPLAGYDENRWATALDYHEQDTEDALELFRLLRLKGHALIKTLSEDVWSNKAIHSEYGEMSFDEWLDVYERHIPEHIQYMQENYDAWIKSSV